MSELVNTRENDNFRKQLLGTASAFALVLYVSSSSLARADGAGRPTFWIELGGQTESLQGTSTPFTAPFMTALTPAPAPYHDDVFNDGQRPARTSFGLEGKVIFQPENSDWTFSAGLRYGRSHTNRHPHNQTAPTPDAVRAIMYIVPFADVIGTYKESHLILDFMAGRDMGIGSFGQDGHSTIGAGIRLAQFSVKSSANIYARPNVVFQTPYGPFVPFPSFDGYSMSAHATRSFHGVGPSLSWDASAAILGNAEAGEITLNWGVNAAILFGRQKAKTDHATHAYHLPGLPFAYYYYQSLYTTSHNNPARSRTVAVPNLGGFAGLSVKYPNVKVSLGYRADFFFGAVDAGIDERHTKDLGFHGPFASVSIGLGG